MSVIANIFAALVAKKAEGAIVGLLSSKTMAGVTAGAGATIWAILPRVLEKDPEAIGQLVLMVIGYILAAIGRLKAKPKQDDA